MRAASRASKTADIWFRVVAGLCASTPVLFLVVIGVVVLIDSIPVIRYMGWHFLTGVNWDLGDMYGNMVVRNGVSAPAGATYGALPYIVGTLASSVLAMLIAIPVSVCTAVILAYRVHGPVKSVFSILVELLAGIPSVVFGLWGMVVLGPWIVHDLGPAINRVLGFIPFLRGSAGTGLGLLNSALVLALMVVPILTATTRDLLEQVPVLYREGGIGLGMTDWEVIRRICLPYVKDGLIGAVALGWGRAMGETMAVLMVGGSGMNALPHTIFSPISTMASVIANQLDSALTDATHLAVHALAELALVLMVLTLITNWLARILVQRSSKTLREGVRA